MNRSQIRTLLEKVTGLIPSSNFSFLESKDERLNQYATQANAAFPLVHCYPIVWSTVSSPLNAAGYMGTSYAIRLEFLKLLTPDESSDIETLQDAEDEMDEAARQFIVILNDYVEESDWLELQDVRCQVRDQQPASANILVGVDMTFVLESSDSFDYCEIADSGEIIIPPVPDRYVYFAGSLTFSSETEEWTINSGSLNLTGASYDSTVIGYNGAEKLKIGVNASSIIASSISLDSNFVFNEDAIFAFCPQTTHIGSDVYVTFAFPQSDITDGISAFSGTGLNASMVNLLYYDNTQRVNGPFTIYIQGVAKK